MADNFEGYSISSTPPRSTTPAVSVIIPLYNAEQYIGECLDSVLLQTFQNFEVIVVDDCSTDNSVAVVESYAPKFHGRLTLTAMGKNSGGGGYVPRNVGLSHARGEYVFFMDADDFILLTALETLYTAAKENNADVVYTGSHYELRTSMDFFLHRDGEGKKLLKEGLEDKIELRIDDVDKNLSRLLLEEREGNFRTPWSKFLRRDFLTTNKIFFPTQMTTGGDFIWVINVYCQAKRFLRLPLPLYFYRRNNTASITQNKRLPSEHVFYWFSAFVDFTKNLELLEKKNDVLAKKPAYCFAASKWHFLWCLNRTDEARKNLSSKDICEILYNKFSSDSSELAVPFLFSFIDAERKANKNNSQAINALEKQLAQFKDSSECPAVSVVIPLYNAEQYIGECLDSLLNQTFQNFEVIVVDDCSTDNSVAVVESYTPKFNGRLTLTAMEKNSGGGALPRNKGLSISRGEYVQFVDADDMLTKTALEELYKLAKDYDADVVSCEKYHEVNYDGTDSKVKSYQKGGFVGKPTFEAEDLDKRVQGIINERHLTVPWNKFVKRSLVMTNEIFFPNLKTSEDNIWTQGLVFYAKKFLRVPNIVNIYRQTEGSSQRAERTPQQTINFWINPVLLGLKALDKLMSRHEFFAANPNLRFALLKKFVVKRLELTARSARELKEETLYATIKDEFGERLGEYDVLISALCTVLYNEKISCNDCSSILNKFANYLSAVVDIKLVPKGQGNLEIVAVSDDKAAVKKATWLPKNVDGYFIQSYAGKLEIVAKVTGDGQVRLNLRGKDIRNPADNSKRIPYWIDYTKLTVNDKVIFDKVTPAWHDKSYNYNLQAKAGDEVKVQAEWLPHRSDVSEVKPPIVDKFLPEHTARVDINLVTNAGGELKIISVSDDKADIKKSTWLPKNTDGYFIRSYAGKLKIVTKATADGQINLSLKGMWVRNPEDNSKLLPYWIDYTRLTVNGKIIFSELTSAWHDAPYNYNLNVKAGEEIIIDVEWLPHKSDVLEVKPIAEKFLPYLTGRVDLQLKPKGEGDFKILSVSDKQAEIEKAAWLPKDEIGYAIQSHNGNMEIIAKATSDGQLTLNLKGMNVRAASGKSKRIPYWIDYTKLTVNGKVVFDKSTPAWHDAPFNYNLNVKANDEIKIQAEWQPHREIAAAPKIQEKIEPIADKFLPYLTGRVDLQLKPTGEGDFKIVSVSDKQAETEKASWLPKDEIGYAIQSHNGSMEIIAKATSDGQLTLNLKGMNVRAPGGKSKRIPYWIDYTKFVVNGKIIFAKATPVWHNKSYEYKLDVKAGEEIKIQTEWLPHRSEA